MAEVDEVQENSQEKNIAEEAKTGNSDGKKMKIEDLKVSELKNELEKRNLDKTGLKSALVERLKADMMEKGENPEDYDFSATPSKSASSCQSDNDPIATRETNEASEPNDDLSGNDEKQEIALQLSLDEEEAQLNEDNLLENSKQLDVDNSKVEEATDLATKEKPSVNETNSSVESEKKKESEKEEVPGAMKSSETEGTTVPKVVKKVVNKGDKLKSPTVLAKSVWISGLANDTKPADLKNLFSGQGKVLSVKILKSAKQTPAKCFGLVTMATTKDAIKAIQNLHHTELNGRVISVEKKSEQSNLIKKVDSKAVASTAKKIAVKQSITSPQKVVKGEKISAVKKTSEKKSIEEKTKKASDEVSGKKTEKGKEAEKSKEAKEKDHKEVDKKSSKRTSSRTYPPHYDDRYRHPDSREPYSRRPFTNQLGSTFRQRSSYFLQKMREDRYQRERLRERREAEQRRLDELDRHRYIERKQREEAYRLEREKERLRIERELLEREKAEIIKLEREKHRLERERLERERDELRRQAAIRVAKRPFSHVDRDPVPVWEERKKPAQRYNIGMRMEAASSSQLDFPSRGRQGSSLSSRESPSIGRVYDRHSDRFNSPKCLEGGPRSFVDREPRREITIRREERQVFAKPDFRDRDSRRSITTREPERSLPARREVTRNDWKQERRVHERVPPSSGPRRMNYY